MGADVFFTRAKGSCANEAFNNAIEEAQYESGHAGYTGTIAEKHDFVLIKCPEGVGPFDHATNLLDTHDERVADKWGPAGCIKLGDDEFLFFGLASC